MPPRELAPYSVALGTAQHLDAVEVEGAHIRHLGEAEKAEWHLVEVVAHGPVAVQGRHAADKDLGVAVTWSLFWSCIPTYAGAFVTDNIDASLIRA